MNKSKKTEIKKRTKFKWRVANPKTGYRKDFGDAWDKIFGNKDEVRDDN